MSQSLKVNESFSHVSPSQYISVVVQWLSLVWLFVAPGTAACQAFLSFTISWSLLKLMSIESVMPSNHLILCHPLLLLPSIFPSIRIFSNESTPHIRWPKYWSFSFSISPSNGNSGLIYYISIHIYTYVCRIYICIFIYSVYLENTDQYTFSSLHPTNLYSAWILFDREYTWPGAKEMGTHSSVLTWRIPGTGEPGGLPSMGSHRVRHDWSDLAAAAAAAADMTWSLCSRN